MFVLHSRNADAVTRSTLPAGFDQHLQLKRVFVAEQQILLRDRHPGFAGIAYARARWYDGRNAGWLSEDPLLDVDSPNLYAFVGWGPQVNVDPLGRESAEIHARHRDLRAAGIDVDAANRGAADSFVYHHGLSAEFAYFELLAFANEFNNSPRTVGYAMWHLPGAAWDGAKEIPQFGLYFMDCFVKDACTGKIGEALEDAWEETVDAWREFTDAPSEQHAQAWGAALFWSGAFEVGPGLRATKFRSAPEKAPTGPAVQKSLLVTRADNFENFGLEFMDDSLYFNHEFFPWAWPEEFLKTEAKRGSRASRRVAELIDSLGRNGWAGRSCNCCNAVEVESPLSEDFSGGASVLRLSVD